MMRSGKREASFKNSKRKRMERNVTDGESKEQEKGEEKENKLISKQQMTQKTKSILYSMLYKK